MMDAVILKGSELMKRILVILLIAALMLCTGACNRESVPNPMSYPDYTFEQTPDTDQLRQTAVRAMRDILSIQWYTKVSYEYYKSGPVSSKQFKYEPGNIYAGILYSNASAGLFQFMEYYDQKTGIFEYPDSVNKLKTDLGISCADAVLWAWSTVCNSITGGFYPKTMVIKNGYIPVGSYTYDETIQDFNYLPTLKIVELNGKKVMMESYAQVKAADALTTSSDNHAMMAIEDAHVEYLADGSIDGENSYVLIQDQRAGGDAWQRTDDRGNVLNYSGRLDGKFSFDKLFEEHFIPVTAAEFIGQKEYNKSEVTVIGDCKDLTGLQGAAIESNYPLAVINVIANQDSKETVIHRELFSGTAMTGVPRTYELSKNDMIRNLSKTDYGKAGTTIKIEVVSATGERFIPIELTV